MPDDDELVEIASFAYRHEAEYAVSVLEAAGIDAIVRDTFFAGMRPHILFTSGGIPLLVRSDDVDEAKRVLETGAVVDEDVDRDPGDAPAC